MKERRERKKGAEEGGGDGGRERVREGEKERSRVGRKKQHQSIMCFKVHQLRLVF